MAKINAHTTKAEKEAPGYYEAWANKFKPKKTTDDCLTPEPVYQAVLDWARREYDIPETTQIVRPFWPGGDYQAEDYSGDCVVIDNPPFSILSEICRWYQERGVRFFLFAPLTQLFSTASGALHYVVCDKSVTYANGARVNTSFVTNLGDDKIRWSPELRKVIAEAVQLTQATDRKPSPPSYAYPDHVMGIATALHLARIGADLRIPAASTYFVRSLDAQRAQKKAMFGGGFLISRRAAAERAAAERAAAKQTTHWELSERERAIIENLSKEDA